MSDESLVVVISKLKKFIKKTTGCSLSMEAVGVINQQVLNSVIKASQRAQYDRRKIIKAKDII